MHDPESTEGFLSFRTTLRQNDTPKLSAQARAGARAAQCLGRPRVASSPLGRPGSDLSSPPLSRFHHTGRLDDFVRSLLLGLTKQRCGLQHRSSPSRASLPSRSRSEAPNNRPPPSRTPQSNAPRTAYLPLVSTASHPARGAPLTALVSSGTRTSRPRLRSAEGTWLISCRTCSQQAAGAFPSIWNIANMSKANAADTTLFTALNSTIPSIAPRGTVRPPRWAAG